MGEFAYIGEASVGAMIPLAAQAQVKLDASLGLSLPEFSARLAGALEAQAQLTLDPPTLTAQLQAAIDLVANLQALVELGLPSASVDLAAIAAIVAELQATIGSLSASATFSASLGGILATAGVYAWTYTGEASGLVPLWAPGGNAAAPAWGIVLAATATAAQAALKATFGVS